MSCPDWFRLVQVQDEEPEAWAAALRHADACDACFDDAMAAEPTLLFRRLPAPRASQADIDAIKGAVNAMRRTQALTHEVAAPRRRRRLGASLASAAVLLLAALLSGGWPGEPGVHSIAVVDAGGLDDRVEGLTPGVFEAHSEVDQMPLVEDVDPAFGSVVQVVDAEMSLVLVLHNGDMS